MIRSSARLRGRASCRRLETTARGARYHDRAAGRAIHYPEAFFPDSVTRRRNGRAGDPAGAPFRQLIRIPSGVPADSGDPCLPPSGRHRPIRTFRRTPRLIQHQACKTICGGMRFIIRLVNGGLNVPSLLLLCPWASSCPSARYASPVPHAARPGEASLARADVSWRGLAGGGEAARQRRADEALLPSVRRVRTHNRASPALILLQVYRDRYAHRLPVVLSRVMVVPTAGKTARNNPRITGAGNLRKGVTSWPQGKRTPPRRRAAQRRAHGRAPATRPVTYPSGGRARSGRLGRADRRGGPPPPKSPPPPGPAGSPPGRNWPPSKPAAWPPGSPEPAPAVPPPRPPDSPFPSPHLPHPPPSLQAPPVRQTRPGRRTPPPQPTGPRMTARTFSRSVQKARGPADGDDTPGAPADGEPQPAPAGEAAVLLRELATAAAQAAGVLDGGDTASALTTADALCAIAGSSTSAGRVQPPASWQRRGTREYGTEWWSAVTSAPAGAAPRTAGWTLTSSAVVSARKDASAESVGLSVAPPGCAAAGLAGGTGWRSAVRRAGWSGV